MHAILRAKAKRQDPRPNIIHYGVGRTKRDFFLQLFCTSWLFGRLDILSPPPPLCHVRKTCLESLNPYSQACILTRTFRKRQARRVDVCRVWYTHLGFESAALCGSTRVSNSCCTFLATVAL